MTFSSHSLCSCWLLTGFLEACEVGLATKHINTNKLNKLHSPSVMRRNFLFFPEIREKKSRWHSFFSWSYLSSHHSWFESDLGLARISRERRKKILFRLDRCPDVPLSFFCYISLRRDSARLPMSVSLSVCRISVIPSTFLHSCP